MALQDLYKKQLSRYSNTDHDWVKYVHDHYNVIRGHSSYVDFNMFETHVMHYRLTDLLRTNDIPASMTWIVLLINQLNSERDFVNITKLLIPDMSYIEQLRERFETVRSNYRNTTK